MIRFVIMNAYLMKSLLEFVMKKFYRDLLTIFAKNKLAQSSTSFALLSNRNMRVSALHGSQMFQ
jgi:hypothetical protein